MEKREPGKSLLKHRRDCKLSGKGKRGKKFPQRESLIKLMGNLLLQKRLQPQNTSERHLRNGEQVLLSQLNALERLNRIFFNAYSSGLSCPQIIKQQKRCAATLLDACTGHSPPHLHPRDDPPASPITPHSRAHTTSLLIVSSRPTWTP